MECVEGIVGPGSFVDRLDPDARHGLQALGWVRSYANCEVAFLQGEAPGRMGLVIDGLVKVTVVDRSGRTALLDLRGPGDVIGMTETLDESPRSSTVTAVGRAQVQLFEIDEFRAFLARFGSARRAVSEVIAERLRESVAHRLRTAAPVQARLAGQLLRLAGDYGVALDDGAVAIVLPVTQDDLAMIVDASRDSVARTLMAWRRQRIVETGRRRITILSPDRLAACS